MTLPIEDLTPRQIVAELDRYIVGQTAAKRAVAVALRNRYRRQQLPLEEREDILPKNILMIGPTGVGKTEIARRLAQLARAPFIKVEATKFTEVGYVGRDVESMIRDLVAAAVRLVEREKMEAVEEAAQQRALDRLVQLLDIENPPRRTRHQHPQVMNALEEFGLHVEEFGMDEDEDDFDEEKAEEERIARHAQILEDLKAGKLDDREVDVEVEEAQNPFVQVFTPGGMEEMGLDMSNPGGPFGTRRISRRAKVPEAKAILLEEESRRMVDRASIHREAVLRAEQTGIVFLDEIDKVAGSTGGQGPDVSREGVQRDLLPIIEGSTVATKFGPVRSDHVLFIAAGAFHMSKPSDLIPELQGRLPIRVELESLSQDDFRKILSEPKNSLTKQYVRLLEVEGVTVEFTPDSMEQIARIAAAVNEKTENIGARRLHTVMERLLEDLLYEAPEVERKHVVIDGPTVRARLGGLADDGDLSRLIL